MNNTEKEIMLYLFDMINSCFYHKSTDKLELELKEIKFDLCKSEFIFIQKTSAIMRVLNKLGIILEIPDKNLKNTTVIGGIPFLESAFLNRDRLSFLVVQPIKKYPPEKVNTMLSIYQFRTFGKGGFWDESIYKDKQKLEEIFKNYVSKFI